MVEVEFTEVDGKIDKDDLVVYALSTCGFYRRALNFLRENSIKFKYVYIDLLDYDVKQKLKRDLYEKFQERPVFPYLVINDEEVVTGFRKSKWEDKLL